MAELALRRQPSIRSTDWLKLLPPASRWILHGGAAARARAAPVWGVELPQTACRATVAGTRAALWFGPDEYLLLELAPGRRIEESPVAAGHTADAAAAAVVALEQALAGTPHALVEVSHRQFALEVSGEHAATIINAGCPLDLDPAEFPVGMCTRTVFAKADVVLWRTRADAFHLEVWRSFADYVSGLLAEIAREFYPG
jgi:sarcosine oxidase subunit gamma